MYCSRLKSRWFFLHEIQKRQIKWENICIEYVNSKTILTNTNLCWNWHFQLHMSYIWLTGHLNLKKREFFDEKHNTFTYYSLFGTYGAGYKRRRTEQMAASKLYFRVKTSRPSMWPGGTKWSKEQVSPSLALPHQVQTWFLWSDGKPGHF